MHKPHLICCLLAANIKHTFALEDGNLQWLQWSAFFSEDKTGVFPFVTINLKFSKWNYNMFLSIYVWCVPTVSVVHIQKYRHLLMCYIWITQLSCTSTRGCEPLQVPKSSIPNDLWKCSMTIGELRGKKVEWSSRCMVNCHTSVPHICHGALCDPCQAGILFNNNLNITLLLPPAHILHTIRRTFSKFLGPEMRVYFIQCKNRASIVLPGMPHVHVCNRTETNLKRNYRYLHVVEQLTSGAVDAWF